MIMQKVLIMFGTRPEAIKMAPVVHELLRSSKVHTSVCVTGQHREMLDQVLKTFEIKPDYDLNIMEPGQDLNSITAKILVGTESIYRDFKPDMLLVHGDTTSALAGCLSAYHSKIHVGHVEAGLRTCNPYAPWPEEGNRKLIGAIANVHFAPTLNAANNLLLENVPKTAVHVTGNTVIDAIFWVKSKLETNSMLKNKLSKQFPMIDETRKMILVTAHRRENIGPGIENICRALHFLSQQYPDVDIVFPVHLNPKIKNIVHKSLDNRKNIYLLKPQEYIPFIYLLTKAHLILTDSGGLQEEAPSLQKPVLLMRNETERSEAIDSGTAKLVGSEFDGIISAVERLLNDQDDYNRMAQAFNPFGDGQAAKRIRMIIEGR